MSTWNLDTVSETLSQQQGMIDSIRKQLKNVASNERMEYFENRLNQEFPSKAQLQANLVQISERYALGADLRNLEASIKRLEGLQTNYYLTKLEYDDKVVTLKQDFDNKLESKLTVKEFNYGMKEMEDQVLAQID